jgi:hypothetical protein
MKQRAIASQPRAEQRGRRDIVDLVADIAKKTGQHAMCPDFPGEIARTRVVYGRSGGIANPPAAG